MDRRYIPGASLPTSPPGGDVDMRWPSWMDPTYQLTASRVAVTKFSSVLGGIQPALPGNSRRWACGFFIPTSGGSAITFVPEGFQAGQGFNLTATINSVWLTLFVYGPLVSLPFTYVATGVQLVTAVEIELQ